MNAKMSSIRFVVIVLSLLLGQRLTFGQEVSGAGLAQQADGAAAEYQTYLPVVISYSFVPSRGVLDPSFDGDGILTTDFGIWDQAEDVALQPDGKVVAAGTSYSAEREYFALARYQPDGSLDETFGSGGKVITDFGVAAYGFAVALQTDGKILVAGYIFDYRNPDDPEEDIALTRYNPDGSLDTSFGVGGLVTTDFYGGFDEAYDLLLLPDGKIVAAGEVETWRYGQLDFHYAFGVARYNPDGSPDSSFSGDGWTTTNFGHYYESGYAAVLQPDGKILVGGMAEILVGDSYEFAFGVARYNLDGSLDGSFGNEGKVVTDIASSESAYAVLFMPDGRIVLAGRAVTGFGLVRYR
jgi:uncharacterized delta-60 repeat protein